MIDIYMTSFFRSGMTARAVREIHERTKKGTFQIHIFDNGSDQGTRDDLLDLLETKQIVSLHLDSRNTGCLYNKIVFHAMTESASKYYCVTDNDVLPPKLTPDWLEQMISIMESNTDLAFLTPQLPPQSLQMPIAKDDDVVFCRAVGNTLKLVRRDVVPMHEVTQALGVFGDDQKISDLVRNNGYRIAFCRNVYCYHAGQCENWGYKEEEIAKDPRKIGYGKPFTYELQSEETYIPADPRWRM